GLPESRRGRNTRWRCLASVASLPVLAVARGAWSARQNSKADRLLHAAPAEGFGTPPSARDPASVDRQGRPPGVYRRHRAQKNTASAPSCSGVVNSSDGCFSLRSLTFASSGGSFSRAARSSICFCTSGVSTQPGQIALQVTPVVAVSSATALVKPRIPCLEAT